jgi:hypothetical protein
MTEHYSHLWLKQYGEIGGDTFLTWAKALRKFEPLKIVKATEEIIELGQDYPPNLIKFLRHCRATVPTYYRSATLLPPPDRKTPAYILARDNCLSRAKELGILSG